MASYQQPDWFTKHVFNPVVAFAVRHLGLSPAGARVLAVRGRRSGEWRTTPVNPLVVEGQRFLVAPRGETQWVRNIRAAGGGELRRGDRAEPIRVVEVGNEEKIPILRAYLQKWAWETGKFFGVSRNPSDADLTRIAPEHPVFRVET